MKASELRDKAQEELMAILSDARSELFKLRNDLKQTKKVDALDKVKQTKKHIARLLTIIREKQLVQNKS